MNGLEEIVLAIKQKAEKQGDDIIAAAKQKAEEIKLEAENKAKAETKRAEEETERKCKALLETSASAAESERLREILKFKSEQVREIIADIPVSLSRLTAEEYFAVLEKIALSNFHKGKEGTIHFSADDLKRLPDDFIAGINKTLKKEGAALNLGEAVNIKNGFVLRYGDIEENCSFDAIINSKEDALKDKIAQILFAK